MRYYWIFGLCLFLLIIAVLVGNNITISASDLNPSTSKIVDERKKWDNYLISRTTSVSIFYINHSGNECYYSSKGGIWCISSQRSE